MIGPHQIPNALCVGRVIVVYVAMYFLLDQYYTSGTVSAIWLGVAAVGALTDKLDGYLAKKHGWTSRLGSYLDHMSDKMVTLVVYAALTMLAGLGPWVLSGLVFRELLVTGLRTLGNKVSVQVPTSQAGRLKTFFQQVAALALAVHWAAPDGPFGFSYSQWVVWAGFAVFWGAMLVKAKSSFQWLRSVYSVELEQPDGTKKVSHKDYYLVVTTFILILVPMRWVGAASVLWITLGTGFFYAWDFWVSARARAGASNGRLAAILRVGGAVDLLVTVGLTAILWLVVARYSTSLPVMAGAVGGFSLLFGIFLVVNYKTSEP